MQHLQNDVICGCLNHSIGMFFNNPCIAEVMTKIAGGEHGCVGNREGPVLHHATPFTIDQANGKIGIEILTRCDTVKPIFGKKIGPIL